MLILTIRTDKPEAEIRLFEDTNQVAEIVWPAHRELGTTIHTKLAELMESHQKQLKDIEGIVAYLGPGSFTGLRIGLSVANALSDGYGAMIVGSLGMQWQHSGIQRLLSGDHDEVLLPEYGAPVRITQQKK